MTKSILTIAGSDPSGGAGIQADLRIFSSFGLAGLSAITALTVQNSSGVEAVHPVDAGLLERQIESLLRDSEPSAVKIGMLAGGAQLRTVAAILRSWKPPNVVLDPVLASSGGVPLLDAEARNALEELYPYCTVVTPNLDELRELSGVAELRDEESRILAGRMLMDRGAPAVLLKGGHLEGDPDDLLLTSDREAQRFHGARVATEHLHGTGCALSSAIASLLARGSTLEDAVREAKVLVAAGLRNPVIAGKSRGYPGVVGGRDERSSLTTGELRARLSGVYVITTNSPSRSHEELAAAAIDGGACAIQLRDKALATDELIRVAKRIQRLCMEARVLFIINDRVDVALASRADGVHLGPGDMAPADARRIGGEGFLIGVSVNSVDEAIPYSGIASYWGVGAIFGTVTKPDAGPPVGLDPIRSIREAFPEHPIVAIGGITAPTSASVRLAGADAIAVISAVATATDPQEATAQLRQAFFSGGLPAA